MHPVLQFLHKIFAAPQHAAQTVAHDVTHPAQVVQAVANAIGPQPVIHPQGPSQPVIIAQQHQFGPTGQPLLVPQGAHFEDQALQNGPQGYVPTSADVAHFQGQPQGGTYNPGYSPLQASSSFIPSQQRNYNPASAWQVNPQQGVPSQRLRVIQQAYRGLN